MRRGSRMGPRAGARRSGFPGRGTPLRVSTALSWRSARITNELEAGGALNYEWREFYALVLEISDWEAKVGAVFFCGHGVWFFVAYLVCFGSNNCAPSFRHPRTGMWYHMVASCIWPRCHHCSATSCTAPTSRRNNMSQLWKPGISSYPQCSLVLALKLYPTICSRTNALPCTSTGRGASGWKDVGVSGGAAAVELGLESTWRVSWDGIRCALHRLLEHEAQTQT